MQPKLILAHADPIVAMAYRIDLIHEGFEVIWVQNALECAIALRSCIPAILILDAAIPWGAGWGILALMKEGELPSVPVLLLIDRTESLPLDLHGTEPLEFAVLYKPVDPRTVADVSASFRVMVARGNTKISCPD